MNVTNRPHNNLGFGTVGAKFGKSVNKKEVTQLLKNAHANGLKIPPGMPTCWSPTHEFLILSGSTKAEKEFADGAKAIGGEVEHAKTGDKKSEKELYKNGVVWHSRLWSELNPIDPNKMRERK